MAARKDTRGSATFCFGKEAKFFSYMYHDTKGEISIKKFFLSYSS